VRAANDGSINASACSVAAGGSASNNTLTCNFGLTPEQLRQVTKAAVEGATLPLMDRIEGISKQLGVTEDAAKTLLRIVGEQSDVPDERLPELLTRIANDYKRLQAQLGALNSNNPTARALIEQAKAEIAAGHFNAAHGFLAQARQAQTSAAQEARKLRDQAQAASDAQSLAAAASAATEGDLAMTELHYLQAAELFQQAIELVPSAHRKEAAKYLSRRGDALYRQGDERGDNSALNSAIEVRKQVVSFEARERVPLDWAAAQNNLGNALERLGERENGTARLKEAVLAYRAALEERTRERVALDWAKTRNNLGNALVTLGERESGTARLEEAVAAYRAALSEMMRERVPLAWAITQNNLGNALTLLGRREIGTARLEEAVSALLAALQEITRERAPLDWAMAQNNLGNALYRLGERESGTARLQEAASAYRAALEERTRERVPLKWAYTTNNLANALAILAVRSEDADRLQEAIICMRGAVEVYRQSDDSYARSIGERRLLEMTAQLATLQKQ